jgi:hypothetical protein
MVRYRSTLLESKTSLFLLLRIPCLYGLPHGIENLRRSFSNLTETGRKVTPFGHHAMPFPSPGKRATARSVSDFAKARN